MRNLIKAILLGILITLSSFSLCFLGLNGEDAPVVVVGFGITSTIIFCTYTIIDTIKKYSSK